MSDLQIGCRSGGHDLATLHGKGGKMRQCPLWPETERVLAGEIIDRIADDVVRYAAQLDAEGNPAKDANGHLIQTNDILGYTVKEKRAGWSVEYPEEKRNGDWEYRVFRADKTANPDTKYDACFGCHQSQASQDFLFTLDSLKLASH